MSVLVIKKGTRQEFQIPEKKAIQLNLDTNMVFVEKKGPFPFARVGYQALYGLSLEEGVGLDELEINALRRVIHLACQTGLIEGADEDKELPMDLLIASTRRLPGSQCFDYGSSFYPDSEELTVNIASLPVAAVPLENIEVLTTLQEVFARSGGIEGFYQGLSNFVKANNPGFVRQWFPDPADADQLLQDQTDSALNKSLSRLLQTIMTSGARIALAYSKQSPQDFLGVCLDHGAGLGIHFPHFLTVREDQRKHGIGAYLTSLLVGDAVAIAISSNKIVVDAAAKRAVQRTQAALLLGKDIGHSSTFQFYHYPINALSAERAFEESSTAEVTGYD